ncbi:hypothetical protein GQ600_4492 [Phytophthora cactorum]|nr:hypothetical protein GQ600_4492 [Phytophthora cactorum]
MQVSWVPPTPNKCERDFSQAKLLYTDIRKSMEVNTLEVLMLLATIETRGTLVVFKRLGAQCVIR